MKADLHVHTIHSGWRHMRLIHPRDCYLKPIEAYHVALSRGMSLVAVTDHNSLSGGLELLEQKGVDRDRVILGEELETKFPDTGQWVHVSILGLTEADHEELHRISGNVRDVCEYCNRRDLLCVLNHPLQSFLWQKPLESYVEDILELFSHVEGLNGSVPALQNRAVRTLCAYAGRAGVNLVQVGGSDAHTAWRVAGAYTEVKAETKAEFLRGVKEGKCGVGGGTLDLAGMTMETYKIIASYYKALYTGHGNAQSFSGYLVDVLTASVCLPAVIGQLPLALVAANQARQKLVSAVLLSRFNKDREKRKLFDVARLPQERTKS